MTPAEMRLPDMAATAPRQCRDCPVRLDGLCAAFGRMTLAGLASASRHMIVGPDHVIADDDQASPHVVILRRGYARLQHNGEDGRRRIVGVVLPGEIMGSSATTHPGYSYETSTEAELCLIDRRVFDRALRQDPALARALLHQRSVELDRLRWLTWALGALKPDERIAALLEMALTIMPTEVRPDGSTILTIELPRTDIADLLATTPETISRVTGKLAARGVIDIIDPWHFRVRSRRVLASLGCQDGVYSLFATPYRRGPSGWVHDRGKGSARPLPSVPLTPVNARTAPGRQH